MTFTQIMWAVWAALVVITFAVYLYRGRLSRDEDDEIFLGEGFEQERAAQAEIAAKVAKVEPVLRIFIWVTAAVTILVIAYWLYDMLLSLHLIG
jgi:hypothetical protein